MYLLILAVIGYLHKTIYMSNDVDFYNFKKLSSVDDKIVMQPTMFYLNCSSRIRCVGKCAASQGCVSVFYSNNSICQGHTEVFERNSHFLVSKPGVVYYVSKNRAEIPCDKIGYTWNSELALCYKLHSDRKTGTDAKAQCTTDHPGSRLLPIDSDAIFTFHLKIIGTYSTGTLYSQGKRSAGNTFVDDDGHEITYFRWKSGEPDSYGDYIRTDDITRLQEVSLGTQAYNFVCRLYGI